MPIPDQPKPLHCLLYADGIGGAAAQVWATEEPGTFLVVRRQDRDSPFEGHHAYGPPDITPMAILNAEKYRLQRDVTPRPIEMADLFTRSEKGSPDAAAEPS